MLCFIFIILFISALEVVDVKSRVLGGIILQCVYALGQVLTAVGAWLLPYWRTYTFAIFSPCLLFIFYHFFVEESVRWLLATGKREEAVRIIFKIAKWNRAKLSPRTVKLLTEGQTRSSERRNGLFTNRPFVVTDQRSIMKQVLSSRIILFRVVVVSFWWVSTTTVYYGLSYNAVSLVGNMYINFVLTSVAEIPGALLCWVTLNRFGRKSSIMSGFFTSGIALLILPVIENCKW